MTGHREKLTDLQAGDEVWLDYGPARPPEKATVSKRTPKQIRLAGGGYGPFALFSSYGRELDKAEPIGRFGTKHLPTVKPVNDDTNRWAECWSFSQEEYDRRGDLRLEIDNTCRAINRRAECWDVDSAALAQAWVALKGVLSGMAPKGTDEQG